MKRIEVRWFAAYREATGTQAESVATEAHTVAELFAEAVVRHQGLSAVRRAMVAVNGEMTDWDAPLAEGDEVLFFPPVAGG